MKKWLIVCIVLLAVGTVAAALVGYQLNTRYGWLASTPVFHEIMATGDTRVRASVDTVRLGRELAPYIPEDVALPDWLPWDAPALLPRVLPHEVAVLGGADFRQGNFNFTLFINEQRGGPVLPGYLNSQARLKQRFPAVTWEEPGFTLQRRGILSVNGFLPLPSELESMVRETWSAEPPAEPLTLLGGHLAEAVIDNRNGEILTLMGALAPVWNMTLEQIRQNPMVEARLELLTGISNVRVAVDFASVDNLLIQIRIEAEPEVGGQLGVMVPFAMPMLAQQLQRRYGLTMQPETSWNAADNTYQVDLSLTGIEVKLKDYFGKVVPRRPAATAAPAAS